MKHDNPSLTGILFACVGLCLILLAAPSVSAHEEGVSHDHEGGLGKTALAVGDTLVFSFGEIHCSMQYLGPTEFGHEINISNYTNNQFEERADSNSYLVQSGEVINNGKLVWLVTQKPSGKGIILEHINKTNRQ